MLQVLKVLGAIIAGLGLFVGTLAPAAYAAGPEEQHPPQIVKLDQAGSDEVSYEIRSTYVLTTASCTDDGLDENGQPCLAIDTTGLMGDIFKWSNMIIPVLLPIAAIAIGLMFGSQIVGGLKSFFSSFRIMG